MAVDLPKVIPGKQAGGDLSSDQYKLVKDHTTAGQVVVCSNAADIPQGALYNKPSAAGQGADVTALSSGNPFKVKVAAGGVTAGWVGTDAAGLLVNKSSAGDFCIGRVDQAWAVNDVAVVDPLPTRLHA
jgi:hypothetical protein